MTDANFQQWRERFRKVALRSGISTSTFEFTLGNTQPNRTVIEKDENQVEFTLSIWQYLDRVLTETRVAEGTAALKTHSSLLREIENEFGVPAEIIVAIWGVETNFGCTRGEVPVVQALATLCAQARRGALFERQLLAALRIVQSGNMGSAEMVGSWAGAMGHTQFMPTSFCDYAVDWNNDGRRDICADDPADALASTANFLRQNGWRQRKPWFSEVGSPNGFDLELAGPENHRTVSDWLAFGISFYNADIPPSLEAAALNLPTGFMGPAFLMFKNASVLRSYNNSDAYIFAVGLLAQRIKDGQRLKAEWPRHLVPLNRSETRQLQTFLTQHGHGTFGADGLTGPNTFRAIRSYQCANALPPDGYASRELFELLKT